MNIPLRGTLVAALACGTVPAFVSTPAAAATDTDLVEIRQQLKLMKDAYEQRIAALEAKLAQTESTARRAGEDAARAQADATAAAQRPASASSFNPEISLVLSGNYTRLSQSPSLRRIQGFVPAGGEAMPETRSFNLGESELGISANIDPLFRGNLRLSVAGDNTVGVEEATVETLALGAGANLKAGRFLSGIGYQNQQHAHTWDFSDAPLAYQAFFGGTLGMDGVQARWLAPTPFYLELGAEAARARSFPANDEDRDKNGLMSGAVFAHAGGDVGISNSWRAGVSYFGTSPSERSFDDPLVSGLKNHISANSRTWVLDGVWKWAPGGDASERYVKLQGEYFRRSENGALTYDTDNALLGTQRGDYRSRQSGFYAQAVWQFMPRWRVGYRYDRLDSGTMALGLVDSGALTLASLPLLAAYNPHRNTLMADWSPSEFSRIRLQFARDASRPDATDNQVWLQYVMSLGAHGAHNF